MVGNAPFFLPQGFMFCIGQLLRLARGYGAFALTSKVIF